ncbi:MAG TPA: lipopolysaccharide heptosyltransferase II [Burkholderiales bacterium]|nr:lipopolysaccharide heptosyltransferase II [Burkholderiales bacterium]
MPRILVVAPNWIGDALMAQPMLARLREKRPGVEVHMLAPEWVAPVARRMPEVDEVIPVPFRHGALQLGSRWRLARTLKKRAYEEAIVLPNSWKSALVPFLADIPRRSGYVGEARYGLLNRLHKKPDRAMRRHYARLADAGDAEQLPQVRLRVDAVRAEATRKRFGVERRYAVLCPGAEYGPAKRWPYFAELAARLSLPVVLLGSASDAPAAAAVKGNNLVGKTTLDEAIDLIAGAELVVSNDSGLMHVAAALGRPLVALFGSSSPEKTPPQPGRSRVLWLKPECSPCFQRECPLGHFRCMRELSVDMVLKEAGAL